MIKLESLKKLILEASSLFELKREIFPKKESEFNELKAKEIKR